MRKLIAVAVAAALLSGCGEPKIDGSSDEAFKKWRLQELSATRLLN
ncbi:lipoprotein [Pseudomonas sp. JY-Q]|nr:lipoprotein [Pseudomonas sp. JY-Q]